MVKIVNKGKSDDYVYDISLDGTVVNAIGLNIVSNTDGFNFQLPKTYRYTKENPYIGKGLSREVKEGKEYVGYEADVAEFNDKYMGKEYFKDSKCVKMGLGIDEILTASCNISRKNYLDYFPEKPYPKDDKMVGNTLKSKKMPEYIEKFLDKGVRLLLQNKGQDFLNRYYEYISNIYNLKIPLKEIASKGKVKKSIEEYKADCNTFTKSGSKKSRQAWMELAIQNNVKVDLGETLYYINTGTKKGDSDVIRKTYYFSYENGEKVDKTKEIEKEWKVFHKENKIYKKNDFIKEKHPELTEEDVITLNCVLLPKEIIEMDDYINDDVEYNVPKYIEQFNKRITPLLVCFQKDIRNKILIKSPSEKQYFTEEEAKLSNGEPNKEGDQDTYEQIMTMEDKEIKFWMNHPEWEIPFLNECGMDWEKIKNDYVERMEREKQLGIDKVRETFYDALNKMTDEELDNIENGELPKEIEKIVTLDPTTLNLLSKDYNDIVIANIYDIFDYKESLKQETVSDI